MFLHGHWCQDTHSSSHSLHMKLGVAFAFGGTKTQFKAWLLLDFSLAQFPGLGEGRGEMGSLGEFKMSVSMLAKGA